MSGDDGRTDRPDHSPVVRASDAERQQAVERLNRATAEGRLTLAEFSERAAAAYAATTAAELVPLLEDLPATAEDMAVTGTSSPPAVGSVPLERVPVGAIKRSGRWRLDRATRMVVALGPVKLDLSGAEVAGPAVDLYVTTTIGTVKVWVPVGARVTVDGATTIGTRFVEEDTTTGPGPLIRLHLNTMIGTVKVYRV